MLKNLLGTTGLSFERLRAFLEIAEARGISRASNGNPNRQSQLSRQLAELEVFFGTPLISRGRGVAFGLTERGGLLKAIAAQQFAALEELKQQGDRGPLTIRIAAGEVLLAWFIIPAVAAMSKRPANLRLSLLNRRSADVIAGVADGGIELGVIHREPSRGDLRSVALGAIPKVLVTPEALNRVPVEALPLAVMEETGHDEPRSEPERAPSGREIFCCSSYQQMRELVAAKCCAAVLPRFMAQTFSSHDFRVQPLRQSKADWRLQAISNPKLIEHRPVAAKLVMELIEGFRKQLAAPN